VDLEPLLYQGKTEAIQTAPFRDLLMHFAITELFGCRRLAPECSSYKRRLATSIVMRYYRASMGLKHRTTLNAVFEDPVRSNIVWRDIESMLKASGAEISEGAGSRVRIALNGVRAVFHRPHSQKEADKGAVKSMRRFLTEAGVTP
jgi:hypothetical protein